MMPTNHHVRVAVGDMSPERLDTGFYSAEYFRARELLDGSGLPCRTIGDVCEPWCFGAYALCNHIKWATAEDGVPFLKAEALGSPLLNESQLSYVTKDTHQLLSKSQLRKGDIIVATSGTIGPCAVVPQHVETANSNQDTIKFRLPGDEYDPYFTAAWLSSRIAQAFLRREAGGAVQSHIYLYNFKRLPLLRPHQGAQHYIGDKVRIADRFRQISGRLSRYALRVVDAFMRDHRSASDIERAVLSTSQWELLPESYLLPEVTGLRLSSPNAFLRSSRVSVSHLTSRLDCNFYSPEAIEIDERLNGYQTASLQDVVDPSRQITNGVRGPDLQPSPFKLVRLQDREGWSIDFDRCLSISEIQFKDNQRCELRERDVVVAIGGYIGHAAIVRRVQPAVIGQHSAVLPMGEKSRVDEGFLVAYLSSHDGAVQLQRYVSGTVQAGINLEDLRDVRIPVPAPELQRHIGDTVRRADDLSCWSTRMCMAASRFVEALIEGRITEGEFIDAHNAGQRGDRALDIELLLRLTKDGVDVGGQPPLIPDVDALYTAIEEFGCIESNPGGVA